MVLALVPEASIPMSMQLGNRYLAFRLEDSGAWSVAPSGSDSPLVLRGRCSADWHEGSAKEDDLIVEQTQ